MKRHALVVISKIQYKKYPTIVAKDPLAVYAKLCRYYWDLQKNIPITAVIGSIGKTTTKNMIGTVYSSMWQTYYTKANDKTHTTMGFAVQHIPPFAEKMIQEVHRELDRLIYRYGNKVKTVLMNDTKYNIKFENGSLIKTLVLSDCFKGERFHLILVDEQIDKNVYRVILKPMEYNNKRKIYESE